MALVARRCLQGFDNAARSVNLVCVVRAHFLFFGMPGARDRSFRAVRIFPWTRRGWEGRNRSSSRDATDQHGGGGFAGAAQGTRGPDDVGSASGGVMGSGLAVAGGGERRSGGDVQGGVSGGFGSSDEDVTGCDRLS
ncbi:RNA-binding protein [Gracilaria domingensis]|nr:RNA-binding protein [Gracilaria domingensis]